jgi:hypothetical protein
MPEQAGDETREDRRVRIATLLAALTFALAAVAPAAVTPAAAESITFRVQSKHPNIVDVEFYSRTRNVVWPGSNKVYSIRDDARHAYKLNCNPGERICYSAWVRGNQSVYWGQGFGGKNACRNCCYTCDGGVADVTLNR